MKKRVWGILPLFFLAIVCCRFLGAVGNIPDVVFHVNGTYSASPADQYLADAARVTIAFPVKVSVSVSISGGPPESHYFLEQQAPDSGCPENYLKYQGHCYPTEPSRIPHEYTLDTQVLAENGAARVFRPLLRLQGSSGPYVLNGEIRMRFTRIFEMKPIWIIKVTSPAGGAVYARNQSIPIAWISMGKGSASVKIRLVPQAEPAAAFYITTSTENDGSYSWRAPSGYPGQVWIEVGSLDGKVVGKSGLFVINP